MFGSCWMLSRRKDAGDLWWWPGECPSVTLTIACPVQEIRIAEITFLFCCLRSLAKHWQHTKVTTKFPYYTSSAAVAVPWTPASCQTAVLSHSRDKAGNPVLSVLHSSCWAASAEESCVLPGQGGRGEQSASFLPFLLFAMAVGQSRSSFHYGSFDGDGEPSPSAFWLFPAQGDVLLLLLSHVFAGNYLWKQWCMKVFNMPSVCVFMFVQLENGYQKCLC